MTIIFRRWFKEDDLDPKPAPDVTSDLATNPTTSIGDTMPESQPSMFADDGFKAASTDESPASKTHARRRAAFQHQVARRINRVLDEMTTLQTLADRYRGIYEPSDASAITQALSEALVRLENALESQPTSGPAFGFKE